jgi:hypothetical protein
VKAPGNKSALRQAIEIVGLTFVIGALGEERKAIGTRAASAEVRVVGRVRVALGQREPTRANVGVRLLLGQGLSPSGERERNRDHRRSETSENDALKVRRVLVGNAGELDARGGV